MPPINQTASRAEAEAAPSDSDSDAGDDGVDNADSQGAESTRAVVVTEEGIASLTDDPRDLESLTS